VTRRTPLYALYVADSISLAGNAVAQLAIPWFVLTTTGSAALTALVVFLNFLPIVISTFSAELSSTGSAFGRRASSPTSPAPARLPRSRWVVAYGFFKPAFREMDRQPLSEADDGEQVLLR